MEKIRLRRFEGQFGWAIQCETSGWNVNDALDLDLFLPRLGGEFHNRRRVIDIIDQLKCLQYADGFVTKKSDPRVLISDSNWPPQCCMDCSHAVDTRYAKRCVIFVAADQVRSAK